MNYAKLLSMMLLLSPIGIIASEDDASIVAICSKTVTGIIGYVHSRINLARTDFRHVPPQRRSVNIVPTVEGPHRIPLEPGTLESVPRGKALTITPVKDEAGEALLCNFQSKREPIESLWSQAAESIVQHIQHRTFHVKALTIGTGGINMGLVPYTESGPFKCELYDPDLKELTADEVLTVNIYHDLQLAQPVLEASIKNKKDCTKLEEIETAKLQGALESRSRHIAYGFLLGAATIGTASYILIKP